MLINRAQMHYKRTIISLLFLHLQIPSNDEDRADNDDKAAGDEYGR